MYQREIAAAWEMGPARDVPEVVNKCGQTMIAGYAKHREKETASQKIHSFSQMAGGRNRMLRGKLVVSRAIRGLQQLVDNGDEFLRVDGLFKIKIGERLCCLKSFRYIA